MSASWGEERLPSQIGATSWCAFDSRWDEYDPSTFAGDRLGLFGILVVNADKYGSSVTVPRIGPSEMDWKLLSSASLLLGKQSSSAFSFCRSQSLRRVPLTCRPLYPQDQRIEDACKALRAIHGHLTLGFPVHRFLEAWSHHSAGG